MKRVIIVHGFGGHPQQNWFPWLKAEMETYGYSVDVPALPNADRPRLKEWLPALQAAVGQPDADTFLVGHSLGCITILRYLESLPEGAAVGGVILVAGFSRTLHLRKLQSFFKTPLDYDRCRSNARSITCINSTNDEYVPMEEGEHMRDALGATLIMYENGGHLNQKAGMTRLPLVRDQLLLMADTHHQPYGNAL